MSGDWFRVMMTFGLSQVTSVASGSGASSRVQPSSKSSRLRISKRPDTLVAAPRPRRRSTGARRSPIAAGLGRGSAEERAKVMAASKLKVGTDHERSIAVGLRLVKSQPCCRSVLGLGVLTWETAMRRRRVGASGPEVGEIGLGAMGMSDFYGPADRAESIATIHAALDSGATLIDTGDFYGAGHNEMLIAEALRGRRRDDYVLSVKFGALRDPSMGFIGYDARPEAVKNFLTYSLKRLGVDFIDIYRPARLDPAVPIEDTVGAIAEMVKAGYVRAIGLSEVNADTIRRAAAVHPISDLQIEYSLIVRLIEAEILPACRALGIGITAYGVLAR